MVDYARRGQRVQVIRYTQTKQHQFRGGETGTIVAETPNGVGRMVATIHWDGEIDYGTLFSDEVQRVDDGQG